MTKKDFRHRWEAYFSSFTDAELFAIHLWINSMQAECKWYTYVGKIWDAHTRVDASQEAESSQLREEQAVH